MNIYDIAREAGVSISTVSRVANRKPCVKASTRKRVEALLNKYHYFADEPENPAKNQQRTVAILVNNLQYSHYWNAAGLIERYLSEHSCLSVLLRLSCEDGLQNEYIDLIRSMHVDGIVMLGAQFQTPKVKSQIQQWLSDIPIVMNNAYFDLPNVYGVLGDEKHGVRDCVDLLADGGRCQLGYLYTNDHTPTAKQRLDGYQSGMRGRGLEERSQTVSGGISLESGYKATKKYLKKHPDTQGIIFDDDLLALGGLRALKELDIEVPGQIAVIGINNSLYGEVSTPALTSLDNKLEEGCFVVAQVLIGCMINNAGAKKLLLPCEITERETT